MGSAESCSLVGLSVQPIAPTRDRGAGVVLDGGAPHGIRPALPRTVSLRRRVAVATPDPGLTARVAAIVVGAGHEVELATDSPFDAMEAAFSRSIEVLVLDQQLQRVAGTEIAALVRSVGASVTVVVLHRGELAAADDLLVLDPTRPGFEDALANVLQAPPTATAVPRGRRSG
jgi:PleD family two-component response regulator